MPFPPGYPRGDMPWLYFTPQSLYWGVRHAAEVFGVPTFLITENGAACREETTADGDDPRPRPPRVPAKLPDRTPPRHRRGLRRTRLFCLVAAR